MASNQNQLFQACLFDLDGTLLDTAPEFAVCMNHLLKAQHKPQVSTSKLRSLVSLGAKKMVQACFELEDNDPAINHIHTQFLECYDAFLGKHTCLFPGIENLLTQFKQANIPWGIVTNKSQRFAPKIIAQFPCLSASKCLISGDSLSVAKPHSAPIKEALRLLNKSPQETLFIGDGLNDVLASHGAGVKSLVVRYGYIPPQENIQNWQADYIVEQADEICSYFF